MNYVSKTMKSINGHLLRKRILTEDAEVITNLSSLEESMQGLKGNIDAFFLIVMGCIVFFMQCGFAFLEAGSVR